MSMPNTVPAADTGLPDKTDVENAIRRAVALARAGTLASRGLEESSDGDSRAIESLLEAVEDQVSLINTWFHKVYSKPEGRA
jgi:hypothetical protein